ncbi:MAG: redoxin domain-containing protein, partial [Acidimicrobiia bacterium]|nr:redoxin domain-containing protein [Acidimicrobiia bacterium]
MNKPIQITASLTVLALIVLGIVLGSRFGNDPLDVESPLIGQPLPALNLETIDGEPFDFAALSGSPIVINVWASWCLPCRAEHGVLQAGAEAYQGVDFVGIVYQDSVSNARRFLDTYGAEYPNVMDPDARAAIELGVFGVPETFFIDANGIIVAKVQGPVTALILE